MADKEIGLSEFIEQVKKDLLEGSAESEALPAAFLIEGIEVEISVGVSRTNKGDIKLKVLEMDFGVGIEKKKEQVQKVKVTLKPILERAAVIEKLKPGMIKQYEDYLVKVVTKGSKATSSRQGTE